MPLHKTSTKHTMIANPKPQPPPLPIRYKKSSDPCMTAYQNLFYIWVVLEWSAENEVHLLLTWLVPVRYSFGTEFRTHIFDVWIIQSLRHRSHSARASASLGHVYGYSRVHIKTPHLLHGKATILQMQYQGWLWPRNYFCMGPWQ